VNERTPANPVIGAMQNENCLQEEI